MKAIIKQALFTLIKIRLREAREYYTANSSDEDVDNITVGELLEYCSQYNIPDSARIDVSIDGSEVYQGTRLAWETKRIRTKADRHAEAVKQFSERAALFVGRTLRDKCKYVFRGLNEIERNELERIEDIGFYELYRAKDFDTIEKYFSIRMKKEK